MIPFAAGLIGLFMGAAMSMGIPDITGKMMTMIGLGVAAAGGLSGMVLFKNPIVATFLSGFGMGLALPPMFNTPDELTRLSQ